jgi:hypothetical protein
LLSIRFSNQKQGLKSNWKTTLQIDGTETLQKKSKKVQNAVWLRNRHKLCCACAGAGLAIRKIRVLVAYNYGTSVAQNTRNARKRRGGPHLQKYIKPKGASVWKYR